MGLWFFNMDTVSTSVTMKVFVFLTRLISSVLCCFCSILFSCSETFVVWSLLFDIFFFQNTVLVMGLLLFYSGSSVSSLWCQILSMAGNESYSSVSLNWIFHICILFDSLLRYQHFLYGITFFFMICYRYEGSNLSL